ncbi:co-chaperone GroES [Thioclava sp. BHET1]|nr:co-chaperone GroES [Thioclava sp. BHET1]
MVVTSLHDQFNSRVKGDAKPGRPLRAPGTAKEKPQEGNLLSVRTRDRDEGGARLDGDVKAGRILFGTRHSPKAKVKVKPGVKVTPGGTMPRS